MKNSLANNYLAKSSPDRFSIIANFSKQAHLYDQVAHVQKQAALRLAKLVLEKSDTIASASILEIGCGTGLFSKYLVNQFPNQQIYLLDPSASMLDVCQQNLNKELALSERQIALSPRFIESTVEEFLIDPNFKTEKHAVIASSFTFQWLIDLPSVIKQLLGRLEKGGQLFFSYPILGSFPEWQASCRNLNLPFTANQAAGFTKLNSLIEGATTIYCEEYFCQLTFTNSLQFFKEIKMLGAHTKRSVATGETPSPSIHLNASDIRRLTKDWNQQSPDKSISCTYKIIEGIITVHK